MTIASKPIFDRNVALTDLYCRKWSALCEVRSRFQDLSKPYLAWVHPDYERTEVRLVVVGKETNGWGNEDVIDGLSPRQAVETLMRRYKTFALGGTYPGKQAFWVPVNDLYQRLNPNGPRFGFVALNASNMDQDQGQPNDEVRDALIEIGLLKEEIRILQPHVIVFHTGPRYETWLDRWFPDLSRDGDMWLARLRASGLPARSFRSYHPQYLNRRSRRGNVYDRIQAEVFKSP